MNEPEVPYVDPFHTEVVLDMRERMALLELFWVARERGINQNEIDPIESAREKLKITDAEAVLLEIKRVSDKETQWNLAKEHARGDVRFSLNVAEMQLISKLLNKLGTSEGVMRYHDSLFPKFPASAGRLDMLEHRIAVLERMLIDKEKPQCP